MKGAFPPQRLALYAKVFYCFKEYSYEKESNFSVKSEALRRKSPFHILSNFCSFQVLMSLLTFI